MRYPDWMTAHRWPGSNRWPVSKRRRARLSAHLSLPLALEEAGPPSASLHLGIVLLLFLAAGLIWAAVTQVRQIAVASGQVVPSTAVQSVQHLEGGIVAEIVVTEGARVRKGTPLLRLHPTATAADLEQVRAREAALSMQLERLRAYAEERMPDFSGTPAFAGLGQDQLDLLATRRAADDQRRRILRRQLDQEVSRRDGLTAGRASLEAERANMQEQLALQEALFTKGLVSRLAILEARRLVAAQDVRLAETTSALAQSRQAVRELAARLEEDETRARADAVAEMAATAVELAETRELAGKMRDRFGRLEIRAPVDGIVQGLTVETVGGVIGPGQELMQIVPVGETLEAEVRIDPDDIGQLHPGQPAAVKVTAYDVARLGDVSGRIATLSPSTFLDENGQPYYRARISLDTNYVGPDPGKHAIMPGMLVTASIQTGRRSVLRYLAGPAYRVLDTALRE